MLTVSVVIQGISSLLIRRFSEDAEQGKPTRRVTAINADPRTEATKAAYIAKDGTFYFSAFAIPNAMSSAGANHKTRGSRKTLRFVVPSAVRVTTDTITIRNGGGKPVKGFKVDTRVIYDVPEPAKDFEVDSRPVTIPATKGRIMRHRPRFDNWSAAFDLEIDDNLLDPAKAHELLTEAGMSVGIGDFRPEKRGPFGRFRVTSWKEK